MGDRKIRLSVERDTELEETRAKANRRKPKGEKSKAPGVESLASPTVSSLKGQVDILGDTRFSSPANKEQLANTVVSLQKQQGNAYVQKVVKRLQASSESEAEEKSLERAVQDLQQQKGSGHPIEGETKEEMEQSLGYDLGQVRLHTDGAAHKAAEDLGAKAFTMGTDIFLSQKHGGNLSSSEGKGLLAHELTHVVQQNQGNLSLPGDKVKMGQPGDAYETEADKVAEIVSRGTPLQRQPEEEEEELLQGKLETSALQQQVEEEEEEEETLQAKPNSEVMQRQVEEEEEELQMKAEDLRLQRQEEEEEEIQTKLEKNAVQMQEEEEELIQAKMDDILAQRQVEEEGGREGETLNPKTEALSELKNAVEKVRTSLERKQIKGLLRWAGTCMVLGLEAAAKEAIDEATEIALTMLKRKIAGFDVQFAKREMVTELLNAAADVLKLGGDEKAVESAMKKALDWAEAQLNMAVEKLKTTPTEATAKQVLMKAGQVMLLGGDATKAVDLVMAWKEESGKTTESATAG